MQDSHVNVFLCYLRKCLYKKCFLTVQRADIALTMATQLNTHSIHYIKCTVPIECLKDKPNT